MGGVCERFPDLTFLFLEVGRRLDPEHPRAHGRAGRGVPARDAAGCRCCRASTSSASATRASSPRNGTSASAPTSSARTASSGRPTTPTPSTTKGSSTSCASTSTGCPSSRAGASSAPTRSTPTTSACDRTDHLQGRARPRPHAPGAPPPPSRRHAGPGRRRARCCSASRTSPTRRACASPRPTRDGRCTGGRSRCSPRTAGAVRVDVVPGGRPRRPRRRQRARRTRPRVG